MRIPNCEVMWLTIIARVLGVMASRNIATIAAGPPPVARARGNSFTTMPRRFAIRRKIETAPPCS